MGPQYYEFEPVTLSLDGFDAQAPILDVGGGGEGVIGRLRGRDVVAIDLWREELDEAPVGPHKVVMDARHLAFQEGQFNAVTAFFSLMYMPKTADQRQVFAELRRALEPGGVFHLWEVALPAGKPADTDVYVVNLRYRLGGEEYGTGYGARWPEEARNEAYYSALASEAGFRLIQSERNGPVFHLEFQKETPQVAFPR